MSPTSSSRPTAATQTTATVSQPSTPPPPPPAPQRIVSQMSFLLQHFRAWGPAHNIRQPAYPEAKICRLTQKYEHKNVRQ